MGVWQERMAGGTAGGPALALRVSVRLEEAVVAVEGSDAVGLGHRGIVKRRVDEIHERVIRRRLGHDGLADVDDLAGVGAETVNGEDGERFAVKENLEHADG